MRSLLVSVALLSVLGCSSHKTTLAAVPPAPALVDSPEYIKAAVETLSAYTDDADMAPLEGKYIDRCARDIMDLRDPSLTTSIAERRDKLNQDLSALHADDEFLQKHYLL